MKTYQQRDINLNTNIKRILKQVGRDITLNDKMIKKIKNSYNFYSNYNYFYKHKNSICYTSSCSQNYFGDYNYYN